MARMVNIDDLIEAWRKAGMFDPNMFTVKLWDSAWGVPIMDAEPIVRCGDCKYLQWNMRQDGSLPLGVDEYECRHWCGSCDPTDFCSHGERQNDGDDKNTD